MLGRRPYVGKDRATYKEQLSSEQVILKKKHVPENWNLEAADFINKCIRRHPESRLGLNGIAELKAHVWLKEIKWKDISKRVESAALWKPKKGFKLKVNKKAILPTKEEAKMQTPLQMQDDYDLLNSTDFQ